MDDRKPRARLFYLSVGLGMLLLLILDLKSGGEVSLQLPMLFFMGIMFTGPIFLVIFIIPSIFSTYYAHQSPSDLLLLILAWIHILFWLFILNNLMFIVDMFVVSQRTIHLVWGGYSLFAIGVSIVSHLYAKTRF